jgi:hypothetical protein
VRWRPREKGFPIASYDDIAAELDVFIAEARKAIAHAEQAKADLSADNAKGACNAASLAAYPLAHVQTSWTRVIGQFRAAGFKPTLGFGAIAPDD